MTRKTEAAGIRVCTPFAVVIALALSTAGCAAGSAPRPQASHGAYRVPVYLPRQDPALYNYNTGGSG